MSDTLPSKSGQDQATLVALHDGRVDAFRNIFDTYAERLQHFAQLWVLRDVAEDVVQDVMFDVWRRRQELDVRNGNLSAYLFSAVRNRIAKLHRHSNVVARAEDSVDPDTPIGMGLPSSSPDAQAIEQDLEARVENAMAHLSPMQRAVLMLRWTQDMSFGDVARTLSISENAAKLHMSRARQVLAPLIREKIRGFE